MKAEALIHNAMAKHGIYLKNPNDENILRLVRYALHVGQSEGWQNCKEMLIEKKEN